MAVDNFDRNAEITLKCTGCGPDTNISTILFDLDNTLIETRQADLITCNKVARWLEDSQVPCEVSLNASKSFLKKFRSAPAPDHCTSLTGLDKWRRNIWASVLPEEYSNLLDNLYSFWKRERLQQLVIDPSVARMLKKLHKRYKLILITNGSSVAQWEKINCVDAQKFFDAIVVSGDLDVEKPQKDIYDIACGELEVEPSECVMVGDRKETDILGGVNAGVAATVWLDLKTHVSSPVQPDFTITKVTELVDVLPLL